MRYLLIILFSVFSLSAWSQSPPITTTKLVTTRQLTIPTDTLTMVLKDSGSLAFKGDTLYRAVPNGPTVCKWVPANINAYKFAPFRNGTILLGNSITKGCCPDATYTPWVEYLSQWSAGIKYTNFAISGSGVRKQTSELFYNTGEQKTAPIGLFTGFNNLRVLTDTAAHMSTVRSAYRAIVSAQFADHIEAPGWTNASTNPNVTYSNGNGQASSIDSLIDWGSHTMWFRLHDGNNAGANWFNKASVVANETISIASLVGQNIFIGTWGYYGSPASRIKVTVDGVDKITWDPNNRTYLGQPEGFIRDGIINDAIVITGLTNSSHSVVITFLDAGKRGAIDCFGTLKTPEASFAIPAHILAFPHMNSTGYNYPGGEVTAAILDAHTKSLRESLSATFPRYALNFISINGAPFYNPDTDNSQISSDGIHPNNVGQKNIALAVYNSWFKEGGGGGSAYNIQNLGANSITTGGGEILISNEATSPSPYSIGMIANSSSGSPVFFWNSKTSGTDQKFWDVYANSTSLTWRMVNDAQNAATDWMKVNRFGMQVENVTFPSSGIIAKQLYSSVTETVDSTLQIGNKPIGMGRSNAQRPFIYWRNNAAGLNQKMWDMYADTDTFHIRAVSDDNLTWSELMQFSGRSALSVDKIIIPTSRLFLKNATIGSSSDSAWTRNPSTGEFTYSKINGGGTTNLTYTQNATNNVVSPGAGTSATLLTATSSLAGLLDTARAKFIDSARGRLIVDSTPFPLTATYIAYGNASNQLTGKSAFAFDGTNNLFTNAGKSKLLDTLFVGKTIVDSANLRIVGDIISYQSGSITTSTGFSYITGGINAIGRNATSGRYEEIPNSVITSSASTLTLGYGGDYFFSGTTATYTLPAISAQFVGRKFAITIKNRGSGAITVNAASGSTIYDTALVASITVTAGAAVYLMPDGTYINVE